jgi:hypothetical protein
LRYVRVGLKPREIGGKMPEVDFPAPEWVQSDSEALGYALTVCSSLNARKGPDEPSDIPLTAMLICREDNEGDKGGGENLTGRSAMVSRTLFLYETLREQAKTELDTIQGVASKHPEDSELVCRSQKMLAYWKLQAMEAAHRMMIAEFRALTKE